MISSVDWAEAVAWIDESLGQEVIVAFHGSAEGQTASGLQLRGTLTAPEDLELPLINPRPGAVRAWQVGDSGTFGLVEGDFVDAEDGANGGRLSIALHEVHVTVVRWESIDARIERATQRGV